MSHLLASFGHLLANGRWPGHHVANGRESSTDQWPLATYWPAWPVAINHSPLTIHWPVAFGHLMAVSHLLANGHWPLVSARVHWPVD